MPVNVKVPTPLRKFTAGSETVSGTGATVGALLEDLEKRHAGIRERICDEQGRVRRFVNLYINGEDIMIDGGSTLQGAPRWYSFDYSKTNEIDWEAQFKRWPYAA